MLTATAAKRASILDAGNDVIYDASSSGSSVTSATITRFHTLQLFKSKPGISSQLEAR